MRRRSCAIDHTDAGGDTVLDAYALLPSSSTPAATSPPPRVPSLACMTASTPAAPSAAAVVRERRASMRASSATQNGARRASTRSSMAGSEPPPPPEFEIFENVPTDTTRAFEKLWRAPRHGVRPPVGARCGSRAAAWQAHHDNAAAISRGARVCMCACATRATHSTTHSRSQPPATTCQPRVATTQPRRATMPNPTHPALPTSHPMRASPHLSFRRRGCCSPRLRRPATRRFATRTRSSSTLRSRLRWAMQSTTTTLTPTRPRSAPTSMALWRR